MAKRQASQHRAGHLSAQPVHHGLQLETGIVAAQAVVGELAQHNRLLPRQHPGMQQLGEHALDAVGVFAHVF